MAYAIKYTLAFQSLRGVDYTVNILVDNFAGTAQRLRPAANPFTVDEDNTDDYFAPIRTKSGYLRIINEATDLDGNIFDYKDLLATNAQSHQVQLLSGNNIVWIGYIKPVVLTSTLFGYRNTVEIPIQCPLAVLKATNLSFDTTIGTFLTMGQIIHMLFSKLANITWGNLYLTANIIHKGQRDNLWPFPDLNSSVSMFNFMDNINPVMQSGSVYGNYKATWESDSPCADVLEKICQFWGWTLYTRSNNIYLTAPGIVRDYYEIPFTALVNPLSETSPTEADTPINIEDLSYKSTRHSEEYLQGYRKIIIDADVNADDVVIDPMLQDMPYNTNPSFVTYRKNPSDIPHSPAMRCVQQWLDNPQLNKKQFLHNAQIFLGHPDEDYSLDFINILGQYDMWDVGPTDDIENLQKNQVKNSFNFKQEVVVYSRPLPTPVPEPTTRQQLEDQTYFAIQTLQDITLPDNAQLCLYGGASLTRNPYQVEPSVNEYIRAYCRIGDKWWNGVDWTSQMSTFKISLSHLKEFLTNRAICNADSVNALYPSAKGYIIPIGSAMTGTLEVGFLNYPSRKQIQTPTGTAYTTYCITDFNVRCVCYDYTLHPTNKSTQTYSGVANLMFNNDHRVNLSIASGNGNLCGKGQLYGSYDNIKRFGGCSYNPVGTDWKLPEQHLLENMQRVYGQPRHRMKIEVAENAIHANPLTRFMFNNKTYIMQSAKHEYGDDKMVLTLIEE